MSLQPFRRVHLGLALISSCAAVDSKQPGLCASKRTSCELGKRSAVQWESGKERGEAVAHDQSGGGRASRSERFQKPSHNERIVFSLRGDVSGHRYHVGFIDKCWIERILVVGTRLERQGIRSGETNGAKGVRELHPRLMGGRAMQSCASPSASPES